MENFLMAKHVPKVVVAPVDLNTAAVTGQRVSMKNRDRVTFILIMAAATSATAVGLTLRQHNAASAGTSKDLSVANAYYHKIGAATIFTKVEPSSAAAAYDLLSLVGDAVSIVVFEVLAEDLDVANDFAWVSADTPDSGAARLGTVIALTSGEGLVPAYGLAI